MSHVGPLWERLVRAALRRERTGIDAYGRPAGGIAGNVPSSLSNSRDIDPILRAADEIQDEDPNISRILCEHAYTLAQNLDPNSEGRGVLQFKTGLMSVIKQKLAKREGADFDRSQDITRLRDFYKHYRERNNVDKLREEEMELRESGAFSGNFQELERKTLKRKKVFATLKVLGTVLEQLSKEVSPEEAEGLIPEELKQVMEADAAMTEDLIAYNIIPLDAPALTNAITSFPEVRAAVASLKYFRDLPQLPGNFQIPATRSADVLDFLHYIFGFQKGNVSNQRENIVNLLSNEQIRLGTPDEHEPKLDETAVENVFLKSLDNYIKWCNYLGIPPMWSNMAVSREKKLLFVSLYYLIWGEAANVRFLPECLCYIFHRMGEELDEILHQQLAKPAASCVTENGVSFLEQVICPLYNVIAAEANNNENGKAPHSAWRNYDDFNEYFWSRSCLKLGWPLDTNSSFLLRPSPRSKNLLKTNATKRRGKTSFVEHRTFFHLYHSFHRLWIFLFMMFQALAIIAFNDGDLDSNTLRLLLSLGPTFFVMKLFQSALDIVIMYGAYSTTRLLAVSRIFVRFIWFTFITIFICFLYVKGLRDTTNSISGSIVFKIYIIVLGIYAGIQFFWSSMSRIPSCHRLFNRCDNSSVVRLVKWIHQEHYYVGRGMYEATTDYIMYMLFWLVVLGGKFAFAYFLQIKPLVEPTRTIIDIKDVRYSWHDFVSKNNHNALTIASLWAPVFSIYLLDIHIFYTIISAVVGFLLGARDRLGEIRSLDAVHKLFERFPEAFMDNLHIPLSTRTSLTLTNQVQEKNKFDAARFAPFWNEIVKNLREEDYITNLEMELLQMPKNTGFVHMVQWPLFLLASKIFVAKDMAAESDSQIELWERISRDDYMKYAVEECYYTIKLILTSIFDNDGKEWVNRIYDDIRGSIVKGDIYSDFQLKKLSLVIQKVTALTGILKEVGTPELETGAINAALDLYDVIQLDFFSVNMRENYATWSMLIKARKEGRLFSKIKWPRDPELRLQIRRLHSLFTIKDSAVNVPRNLEARRRLEFFTNSLFMNMPRPKPVREMSSFSVFTPYYSETVLYSINELLKKNEDGISILFYLQKIYPDEWKNFLARIGRDENTHESVLIENEDDNLELRFWASYRGQTLSRTVRGMMYYRKALMLQAYLERMTVGDIEAAVPANEATDTKGFEFSPEARAHADLKFTYVVTCQIYGKQKEEQKPEAADIALLLQRNEALRVAFIDEVETLAGAGEVQKSYFSKLVKGDINGKDKEVYSIKLPGNPKLGEGKPENQNHAIIFTRGNAVQTIDMNQDNYFEEALKMRNLLEEFHANHGIRSATILGVREHVFTGSVSSLASFMSNQETSFVTLGQRVLASPLKVRMHYGHPDVFDRVFHITRGGISKASRVINISEDIFAGFNSTLRQGNITHHEYIQVGKGRDVGLNQIALFEGKVAGGNGEQVLSRDIYRLGQLFDFFRMLSFYFTTVGFYFCTMLTVITVWLFLYGKLYLALSGVGEDIQNRSNVLDNKALTAALNTQFLFQIGVFTAIPMVLGFILEQGFLRAVVSFITMQFQLCTIFFTFSLGTRTHYFGRTILHGGAKYHATGRGFVVRHIRFAENYRLYSRSHFVKGLEVVLLLVVYLSYGYNEGIVGYVLLSVSSWFMALSWLFAPHLFNPSGFEWQKTVEDFRDWTNWLFYRGGIGVKGEESWEAWWDEEMSHIRTLGGRLMETILSLRFFIFQYGVIYKLDVQGSNTSLSVYGFSWLVLLGLILLFKIFTFSQKISVNFQLILRFIQGVAFMLAIAGIAVAVVLTDLSITDIFASILAFIPTGWGILSICVAWKPVVKKTGLWKSIRSLGRLYDAGMGMLIFIPIAFCSWFPFISTFQTRLMFNQAFSRGLEISLILAGNNPNSGL
ncbi:putative 1,3-beta-glucan synthase [Helianthus annuus]|uniref:1,3-beta-glucan synthase n=1 Tax=Helianthus annuus TaxID=4232 RepID=A0A9K3JXC2_HELAN|nr:callose synthase 9 [Helianthus annuus]KAF5822901.1 putative 1,3-beta-glucan synthase [Helianthus annuus]KAJ0627667.1 putative 1,3-beta-glucan synthase [Helianthus annuus]KAJ0783966.1 putative 1,3-beta-glucan synthase [Helianthus annuus]KAJ0948912.1 putative 1,3-beta-glucan synthase [Helianthus annuus]KAJ0957768.1 putative 1,3-beta-glucan synthase [Helianthus annuus]